MTRYQIQMKAPGDEFHLMTTLQVSRTEALQRLMRYAIEFPNSAFRMLQLGATDGTARLIVHIGDYEARHPQVKYE